MRQIRLVSDVHLEFDHFLKLPKLEGDEDRALVVAGDLTSALRLGLAEEFFNYHDWFAETVWVPGNHEFYHGEVNDVLQKMTVIGRETGVHVLDTRAVILGGVLFVGATLWTDFDKQDPMTMNKARWSMNDYNIITLKNRTLIPNDTLTRHLIDRSYIEDRLHDWSGEVVVVTHHLPSFQAITPGYRSSDVNGCYASDLDRLIERYAPSLWVFGHSHRSSNVTMPCGTVLRSNPYGYHGHDVNPEFDPSLVLDIGGD